MAIREPILSEVEARGSGPRRPAGRRRLAGLFLLLAVVVIAAIVFGLRPRLAREKALAAAAEAEEDKLPAVNVALVRRSPAKSELELPGDLQGYLESPIFARADGYIRRRLVDYGDRVRAGQLLAELETPELDQQLGQARAGVAQSQAALRQYEAALVQANANLKLAEVTLARWKRLTDRGVFSKQEGDTKQADFEVRQAEVASAQANINAAQKTVEANQANLRRLEELKSFSRVTAPYDGVITSRNMDVGTLVNAGNSGPNREIFRIAQINRLRIFVNVPQTYAPLVRNGQHAELRVQELPGQVFAAIVARSTSSVDENSRTMLAILETPNPRGVLLPGMYTQVKFSFSGNQSAFLVPGDCLMLGREGPRLAVAGPDHIVHLRRIHIAHDYGAELEVDSGVSDGEMVILNPNDQVRENARVEVRGPAK
ncbi:MAG TPA: efflux RND transporter periplasmic adaptor subunit [Bryobacteraceae bacterium]|nr:efflux RND transporter periplasmic adaptor subunit [Bryobacteraceae bacterium]